MIIYQDHSGGQASVNTRGGFMITITLNNSQQRLIARSQRDARARRDASIESHGRGNQRTIGHFNKQEILLIDELIRMNKQFPADRLERLPNDKIARESDIRDAAIRRETTLQIRKFARKKGRRKVRSEGIIGLFAKCRETRSPSFARNLISLGPLFIDKTIIVAFYRCRK